MTPRWTALLLASILASCDGGGGDPADADERQQALDVPLHCPPAAVAQRLAARHARCKLVGEVIKAL